jgi:hypothetical protein
MYSNIWFLIDTNLSTIEEADGLYVAFGDSVKKRKLADKSSKITQRTYSVGLDHNR